MYIIYPLIKQIKINYTLCHNYDTSSLISTNNKPEINTRRIAILYFDLPMASVTSEFHSKSIFNKPDNYDII